MHITFKYLRVSNFFSFLDTSFKFSDDGFIRVSGENNYIEDNALSNGSGKSSLWEGIIWALTGETIRGTKQIVNIAGNDGALVELHFNVDDDEYKITRTRDHSVHKSNLIIYKNNQNISGKGIRDSEKILTQELPDITASLLGSVIILGQGLPQRFTDNTPSGRKEILEKLSKSDFMIDDLKQRVSDRKKFLNDMLADHKQHVVQYTSNKELLQQQILDAQQTLSTLNESTLHNRHTELTAQLDELTHDMSTLESDISHITNELQDANLTLLELKGSKQTEITSCDKEFHSLSQPLSDSKLVLDTQLTSLKRELTKIQSIKDVCPTCGQKLLDVHIPDTTQLLIEISAHEQKVAEVKYQLDHIRNEHDQAIKEINSKYSIESTQHEQRTQELTQKVSSLQRRIDDTKHNKQSVESELSSINNELSKIDATRNHLENLIQKNQAEIIELDKHILYNNNEGNIYEARLAVMSQFDVALKRDFRGYLLSTIIAYIQDRAKAYAQIIFETDRLCFEMDGNNIDISYMQKAYENLSGGEKQKVDLIIQLSIRDMLCNYLNFTSNILVLDEIFDSLDAVGCNRVIDVISSITDIKNIFIVTHRKDLSIPFDKEFLITKTVNGVSELQIR